MEVRSLCPLPVASLLWQPRPGAWMFTFACKATYDLRPGESRLASEQEPLYEADRHWSDDPTWSLYAPRDIVPIRPRADVVLVGHAFAPGDRPVRSLVVRLIAADIDKSIEVFCDRSFTQDGALHEGPRLAKIPLLYERAGGGPDTWNPVGMRPDARDLYGKRELPNLQPPGLFVTTASELIEPVGFGPIAPTWPSRRTMLGRHVTTWFDDGFHLHPLPQDMDASYFNAAPRDQQTATLHDNERVVLDNLLPEMPHLVTNLSGHHPLAFVKRPGWAPQSASMRPDLLWIHTDRRLCTLTWRGQIPLEHAREMGLVMIALKGPGQVLTWEDVERLAGQSSPRAEKAQDVAGEAYAPSTQASTTRFDDEDNPLAGTRNTSLVGSPAAVLPFAPAPGGPPVSRPHDAAQRLSGTPFATPAPPPWRPESSSERAIVGPPPASSGSHYASFSTASSPPSSGAPGSGAPESGSSSSFVTPPLLFRPSEFPFRPSEVPASAVPVAASPWTFGAAPTTGVPPTSVGAAALEPEFSGGRSALDASNAAGAASAPWTRRRRDGASVADPALQDEVRPEVREILHLLWFDPESVLRIRRQAAWRQILDRLEKKPLDRDLDDPALVKEPMEVEDRREVFEILANAGATSAEGIVEAMDGAVRDDGKYVPPLRLIAGELTFPFDELETLKATVTTVAPLVGNDESLRAAITVAQDFLKMPDLRSAPAVAEGLTTRIREAWSQGKRAVPSGYLAAQTERVLLEQRHYQRRAVFGKPHLRALLLPAGSSQPIPTYLLDTLAKELPMYQRFKVRVISEVHLQIDQYENHAVALRGLALARATPLPARR